MRVSEMLMVPESDHALQFMHNILLKRDLMATGDQSHELTNLVIIAGAGAMRGAFQGGVCTVLERQGLTSTFTSAIGKSSGAAGLPYFLSGQTELGASLYPEELASSRFINKWRGPRAVQLDYMIKCMSEGKKKLDIQAVLDNPTRLHIGVTTLRSAQAKYIEIDEHNINELFRWMTASSSLPGITRPVEIDGEFYLDAVIGCKTPIRYAIDELGATDILCVANQPLKQGPPSFGSRALSRLLTLGHSQVISHAYRDRDIDSDNMASTVYEDTVRVGIICPPESIISKICTRSDKLKYVIENAMQQTEALFAAV